MSLENEIQKSIESLLDTFKLANMYGTEETTNPKEYLHLMEEICAVKENEKRSNLALQTAKAELKVSDFEKIYQSELEKLSSKKFAPKITADFKRFKEELSKLKKSLDIVNSDELMVEAEINIYDPICKKRMVEPVRNTKCGHHYEKSTILETIRVNSKYRCPVAGCGNREMITAAHLVDDIAFRKKLMEIVNAEEQSQDETI